MVLFTERDKSGRRAREDKERLQWFTSYKWRTLITGTDISRSLLADSLIFYSSLWPYGVVPCFLHFEWIRHRFRDHWRFVLFLWNTFVWVCIQIRLMFIWQNIIRFVTKSYVNSYNSHITKPHLDSEKWFFSYRIWL